MSEVPISEVSGHLDEVADESAATGEVIYLTRDGQRLAAIVPADAAEEIEAAVDTADITAAEAAMAEPGDDIPGEVVWAEHSGRSPARRHPPERFFHGDGPGLRVLELREGATQDVADRVLACRFPGSGAPRGAEETSNGVVHRRVAPAPYDFAVARDTQAGVGEGGLEVTRRREGVRGVVAWARAPDRSARAPDRSARAPDRRSARAPGRRSWRGQAAVHAGDDVVMLVDFDRVGEQRPAVVPGDRDRARPRRVDQPAPQPREARALLR